jgi:hypothetical protein
MIFLSQSTADRGRHAPVLQMCRLGPEVTSILSKTGFCAQSGLHDASWFLNSIWKGEAILFVNQVLPKFPKGT